MRIQLFRSLFIDSVRAVFLCLSDFGRRHLHRNALISLRSNGQIRLRIKFFLSVFILCNCVSCTNHNYQHDNPGVRKLQEKSLVESPSNPIAGLAIEDFFGSRTGWVLPENSALVRGNPLVPGQNYTVGGRAAAISEDGYYLTAFHVVDGATPVMVLPPHAKTESGEYGSIANKKAVFSYGRVIKHFHPADIALVKFDHRPNAYFKELLNRPKPGIEVFTGATDGYAVGEERIGNGPFKSRGEILEVNKLEHGRPGYRIMTSIVARGGMSGAPIVDSNGKLVSILLEGKWSNLTHRPIYSSSEMVPVSEIVQAIEMDRKSLHKAQSVFLQGREQVFEKPTPEDGYERMRLGALEAEHFRRSLLTNKDQSLEFLLEKIVYFKEISKPILNDKYNLDNFDISVSDLKEAIEKGAPLESGAKAFQSFAGYWFGLWEKKPVDHEWSQTEQYSPPYKIQQEDISLFIHALQYAWIGDGFGWNLEVSMKPSEFNTLILGAVYHVKDQNPQNVYLFRPHVGVAVGKNLIWITEKEVFFEQAYLDKTPQEYSITGFFYQWEGSNARIMGDGFQAVYSRNSEKRIQWKNIRLNK